MKSNARAVVLALVGTAIIVFAAFALFNSSLSQSIKLATVSLLSFLVLLVVVYSDRNLKRARRAPAPSGPRLSGSVKWFNVSKGYGFITQESGEDVFVHYRSLRDADRYGIKEGMSVTFVVGRSGKGPQAEDVVIG